MKNGLEYDSNEDNFIRNIQNLKSSIENSLCEIEFR